MRTSSNENGAKHVKETARDQGARAALLGIAANLMLSAVKAGAGILGGSQALLADAVNSLGDVLGSCLVWLGIQWGAMPPDEDHPYGHGRAETVAVACVGLLLTLAAFQIGRMGVAALVRPSGAIPAPYTGLVAAGTALVKELLYRYKRHLGERLGSPALIANAHDHRSDAFAAVLVLVSIGGAQLSALLGVPWLARMDAAGAVIVSAFVLATAYSLLRQALAEVMDKQVSGEELDAYRSLVGSVNGVSAVDDIRVRTYGRYRVVDVKIAVSPEISVAEGHDIAARVKDRILRERADDTAGVMVHVNPHRGEGRP